MKFNWKKLGVVFNPQDHETPDWMHEFAQAPCVLPFKDFVRLYFSCRPKPDINGQYVSYSAYVDLDRNNLFKVLRISQNPILDRQLELPKARMAETGLNGLGMDRSSLTRPTNHL
jgi:hypothetical protein